MANTATASKMTVSATDVAVEITGMNKWYGDFHVLRDINLKVMRAFEAEGINFAFPTQTVYLANDDRRQLALRMLGEDLQQKQ